MAAGNKVKENLLGSQGRSVIILILILAGILLLQYMILFAVSDLTDGFAGLIQIRMKDEPASGCDVERLVRDKNSAEAPAEPGGEETGREANPLYTAWTEAGDVTIENEELERRAASRVIYYCGDNNPRFDLTGNMSCAVPAELAFRLWGTAEEGTAVGQPLLIGGRKFTVEKVMPPKGWMEKWSGNSVIARVDGKGAQVQKTNLPAGVPPGDGADQEILFDVLDVSLPGGEQVGGGGTEGWRGPLSLSIGTVIMQGGFQASSVIHYGELAEALNALRRLPVWAAALWAAVSLLGRAWRGYREGKEKKPERDIPQYWLDHLREDGGYMLKFVFPPAALGIGLIFLTGVVVGAPFTIPDSFLPTRWSDFSFWTAAMTETGRAVRLFLTMESYGPDLWFRTLSLRIILGVLGQTVLAVRAITYSKWFD